MARLTLELEQDDLVMPVEAGRVPTLAHLTRRMLDLYKQADKVVFCSPQHDEIILKDRDGD